MDTPRYWLCGRGHKHVSIIDRDRCDQQAHGEERDDDGLLLGTLLFTELMLDDPTDLPDTGGDAAAGAEFSGFGGGESGGGGGGGDWSDAGSGDAVGGDVSGGGE